MRTTKRKPFSSHDAGCWSSTNQMTSSNNGSATTISLSNLLLSIAILPAIIILLNIIIL